MNKNNIIGFVLIFAIMMGFSWYQRRQYNEQMEAQAKLDSIAMVEHMAAMALDSIERAQGIVHEDDVKVVAMPAYKDSLLTEARLAEAGIYKLSNDKIEIEFTTRGAQPYSVKINDYKSYDSTDLYLIKPDMSQYGISIFAGESINTKDFVFNVAEYDDSTIVMQLPFASGGYIQQKYSISEGSYSVKNELSFVGMSGIIPRNVSMLDIDWSVIIPRLEKGYKNEKQYSKLDFYFSGDKKPEELGRGRDGSERVDTKFKWFAFQQQFFSAIMTAGTDFASADFSLKFFSEDEYKTKGSLMACSARLRSDFQAGSDNIVIPYEFYFGPNDYRGLKAYDQKYEKIIPLGGWMVGWFSRLVIIPCFDFLGKFISNYGLVILLMTLLIKLLISPLTIKSYKSSAKMQVIKPEVDKLNAKYPNEKDAMKKQQAMMDLYQKAGISPMGGCLPMLLQMPILFAMFRFFPASIELRQQKFLWADDLSAYDSIWDFGVNVPLLGDHLSLFALLMALTMFFYSKMTSGQMSDDPNMAGMKFMSVWLMPIMMFFICNNLSAALSYYYLLSNIITMIMTWYIRKFVVTEEKVRADMMLRANQPKKKSKWQQRLEEAQKMQEQMQKQQNRR
ncbi:MAG: membrane protein insertase YidC [Bacteroidales bacterium]|nr:membrane protein insertase YidC [Bacteroidales bacterium]MBQ8811448.1 membrane protein insertase YidC [Bacteroidales bacterium]